MPLLSSSALSCPKRFETSPTSGLDLACHRVNTRVFCYWNDQKCLYLEDIDTVTIDGNDLLSCFKSMSVILTYIQTPLDLFNMYAGVFCCFFLWPFLLLNLFGKTEPNSEILSARTHRGWLIRVRKGWIHRRRKKPYLVFIFILALVSK